MSDTTMPDAETPEAEPAEVELPDLDPDDSDWERSAASESTILKILSGVQSGVEVALSPGQYTVGSGDEDDIGIIDVSLSARHLELRITPGANQIRAVAGQVRSGNGVLLEPGSDWQEVEPLDVVTAGTTRFAIAAASAAWTSVTDIPAADPEPAGEPPAGGWAAFLGRLARIRPGGQVGRLVLPVAALVVVAGIALWALVPGGAPDGGDTASGPAAFARVQAALEPLAFAREIELRQEVDGVIYATGHVETPAERRAVAGAIDATGVPVNLRVWVLQSMHQEIAGLIEAQARNVTVEISAAGAVALSGLIPDDGEAERFAALVREVPGVAAVRSQLRTPSSLLAEVEQLAQSSQIKPWVLFRLDRGVIEATGALPAEEANSWADFLQVYARRFARDIGLRSFVQLQGVTIQTMAAGQPIGAITIGAQEVGDGDVEIDIARLQGGEIGPNELLVGGGATAPAGAAGGAASGSGGGSASGSGGGSASGSGGGSASGSGGGSASGSGGGSAGGSASGSAGDAVSVAPGAMPAGAVDGAVVFSLPPSPSMLGEGSGGPAASRSAPAVRGAIMLSAPAGGIAAAGADGLVGAREAGLLPAGDRLPAFLQGVALPFGGVDDRHAAASRAAAAGAAITLSPAPAGGDAAAGADRLVGAQEAGLLPGEGEPGQAAGAVASPASGAVVLIGPLDSGAPGGVRRLPAFVGGDPGPLPFGSIDPGYGAGALARGGVSVHDRLFLDEAGEPYHAVALQALAAPPHAEGTAAPALSDIGWIAADAVDGGGRVFGIDLSSLTAVPASATLALGGVPAPAGAGALRGPLPADAWIGAPDAAEAAATTAPGAGEAASEPSLADSTRLLLEQWRDGRLQRGANAGLLLNALENLSRQGMLSATGAPSRLARQRLHDRYLPASGRYGDPHQTCWPASLLKPQDVLTALFWLDILSVGDTLSLDRFDPANRAILIEVALSPRRAARCVALHHPGADIVDQSVYLREIRRNPGFVRFVLRDIPSFSLDVAGASSIGDLRFLLTRAGVRIGEGAFPDDASRLLAVGELGALFETASGLSRLVYGPELNWLMD